MLSFVLITEAEIKISKGMDGCKKGTRKLGINRSESFLQPCDELQTVMHMKPCCLLFFCPLLIKFTV